MRPIHRKMKNSRSIFKKLIAAALMLLMVCTFVASCAGAPATIKFQGNVTVHDNDGIGQVGLNNIAEAMLNNAKLYEGIVAAYRGYNIYEPGFDVVTGETYEAKTKLVPKEALDEEGNPKKDASGNPVYVTEKDENGNDKVDANGNPVYVMVEKADVDIKAALAVLAKEAANIDSSKVDEDDIINLVESLKSPVTFDVKKGLLDNIMYGIGVFLGWLTKYLGFGNYIIGICIFAIILEFIMLPLGIKRQKNSIKQAKLRPKEMAIRKKYAGRNDQATMQKVQTEIQEMYQKEQFNPASGCLPLLLQLPIILVLYNIVIDPLKHVLGIAGNMSGAIQTYYSASPLAGGYGGVLTQQNGTGSIEALSRIGDIAVEKFEGLKNFAYITNGGDVYDKLTQIHGDIPSFNVGGINFGLIPSFNNFNWLLLVPILTFVVYFASAKLSRKFMYQPTGADSQQMGCSNNVMDFMMPAMSVYFAFLVPAAVGVYWMFKSVLSTLQQFVLSKIMPLPEFTDDDYKAAERELAGKAPKNSPRAPRDPNAPRARSLHHIDDEDYDERGEYKPVDHSEDEKKEDEKPVIGPLPEGAAPLKEDAPEHKSRKKSKDTESKKDSDNKENK